MKKVLSMLGGAAKFGFIAFMTSGLISYKVFEQEEKKDSALATCHIQIHKAQHIPGNKQAIADIVPCADDYLRATERYKDFVVLMTLFGVVAGAGYAAHICKARPIDQGPSTGPV